MSSPPLTTAIAALLWRSRGERCEVFLCRRSATARFFGGFWAAPGAVVGSAESPALAALAGGRDSEVRAAIVQLLRDLVGVEATEPAAKIEFAGRWTSLKFSPRPIDVAHFLVEAPPAAAPECRDQDGQFERGVWIRPEDAIARAQAGEWLIPPSDVRILKAVVAGIDGAAQRCLEQASAEHLAPRMVELAAGIAVCPLRSPTLPPATHTNCYVIGSQQAVVIDPATPYDDERAALDRALDSWTAQGRTVGEIVLTHHHPDHIGAVDYLARRLGVPVAAHPITAQLVAHTLRVDRNIEDGEVIDLPGQPARRLRAVFTPGHAPGHLCFLEEVTGMMIAGDMVASIGTIVVDPDEGDMAQYLDSLARMRELAPTALLPAHGEAIAEPARKIDDYVSHRLWRESRVVEALTATNGSTLPDLVPLVYDDISPQIFPLAERSLLAHLLKLERDGRAARAGRSWELSKSHSP